MHRKFTKRTIALGVGVAIVLAGGGVAYAYWTAGGSGTGDAATGTTEELTVNQTTVVDAMFPGDTAQTISGTFDNPNDGLVYVATVTAAIDSVDLAEGVTGTCDASDYTLATPAMTVNAEIPVGTGEGAWTGATIKFNDKTGTNQDACKGATVNLAYTIS